jgi:hypothetical protein
MDEMVATVHATLIDRGCRSTRLLADGTGVMVKTDAGLGFNDAKIEVCGATARLEVRKATREKTSDSVMEHARACVAALAAIGYDDVEIYEATR